MNTNNAELLSAALTGLLIKKRELDGQIAVIQEALDGGSTVNRSIKASIEAMPAVKASRRSAHKPVRKAMSPAARKRIADAQKKRWAKYRKEQKANAANAAE